VLEQLVWLAVAIRYPCAGTTNLEFTYQDALEEQVSKKLYESAVQDGLTGLHNRRYFDERLRAESRSLSGIRSSCVASS
jgi:PleD family two-component response regulator